MDIDKTILNDENLKKLEGLNNPPVMQIVEKYVKHCKPAKVTVITDSKEDIDYVRKLSINNISNFRDERWFGQTKTECGLHTELRTT